MLTKCPRCGFDKIILAEDNRGNDKYKVEVIAIEYSLKIFAPFTTFGVCGNISNCNQRFRINLRTGRITRRNK